MCGEANTSRLGAGVSPALSSVLGQALGQSVCSALAIKAPSQFGLPRVLLSPEEQHCQNWRILQGSKSLAGCQEPEKRKKQEICCKTYKP